MKIIIYEALGPVFFFLIQWLFEFTKQLLKVRNTDPIFVNRCKLAQFLPDNKF